MFGLGICVGILIAYLAEAVDNRKIKNFPFKRKEKRRKIMNELATKKFENQSLAKATEEIIRLQKNVNQSLISVAGISGEVAKSESYKDDGFKSAQEWLMNTFNYKKSTAYTMVKIGKNDVNLEIDGCVPIYKTIFANSKTDEDFTLTQLEKLLPLGKERIELLLCTGDLNYSMTVKEIKELVANTKLLEKEETETDTEETETETEKETDLRKAVSTIEIYKDCIFVDDIKFGFDNLNEVVKHIRKTVKNLNK